MIGTTVRSLAPRLRGEGWGEGHLSQQRLSRDLYPLTRIASAMRRSRSFASAFYSRTAAKGGLCLSPQAGRGKIPYPSALNSLRSTLPVAVIGSVSVNCTNRGYSCAAS